MLIQCPNHWLGDHLLLQYFYQSLDAVNKGIADQLVHDGIMRQTFTSTLTLLDEMTKINWAWCTRDDLVIPLTLGKTRE